ncbi:MAG: DUF1592 domain-containing protein [Pirellulaceae bacterium]
MLTAVLMSPEFCYRRYDVAAGDGLVPLNDRDLAGRLSYFLWSSLPDEELLAAAERGELQNPDELAAHTKRMLGDERVEAFAREFLGQWLRYRDYLDKDPIDAAGFPGYDDVLRESILAEPVLLASEVLRRDQSILSLLDSDETF